MCIVRIKISNKTASNIQESGINFFRMMEIQAAIKANPAIITVHPPPGINVLEIPTR
jgi:hypothetical protein